MHPQNEIERAVVTPARSIQNDDGVRNIILPRVYCKVFAGAIPEINRNGDDGQEESSRCWRPLRR
jgi:hypothetical protein